MKRRSFLAGAAAGAAISTLDWLRFFRTAGVPGTPLELGLARAHAAELSATPRFLVYWFQEGGWDGYSMFNPVHTPNDATRTIASGELYPNPGWSQHRYRPTGYGTAPYNPPRTVGNITYGYLAHDGVELFPDMAVLSSHHGNTFHSGGRFDYHYGKYSHKGLSAQRLPEERTVLQAFAEAYGADKLMPHVSWHRWLSDGELDPTKYPEGTGYYEKLGPAYAHTVYGRTPAAMRARLSLLGNVADAARASRIRQFVDNLHSNFLSDKQGESVKAFAAAVDIHRSLTTSGALPINPQTLFTNSALREEFGVRTMDEETSFQSVNGNPARSKESPNTNVQAMMAWELMQAGLSIGFHIECRNVREFDTHLGRDPVMKNKGQPEQSARMRANLWNPLKAFVRKLKTTEVPGVTGKSYWDFTTIVLCSEMGRTLRGDVDSILASTSMSSSEKYAAIMDQDVSQHWRVNSAAFLGGTVRGNTQWGRVGTVSEEAIPLMPDGTLDPAYDATTGLLKSGATKSTSSVVPDAGHLYSTALHLSGLDAGALRAAGKGKNDRPALRFIAR
jgi:hypothetical protein